MSLVRHRSRMGWLVGLPWNRHQAVVVAVAITVLVSACSAAPTAAPAPSTAATATRASAAAPSTTVASLATTPAPASTGPVSVTIVEPAFQPARTWKFEPASVTVKVGEKITWLNTGAVAHTVTADDGKTFDSGDMAAKAEFSFAPTQAGTFTYHCAYHTWMKGTITVVP